MRRVDPLGEWRRQLEEAMDPSKTPGRVRVFTEEERRRLQVEMLAAQSESLRQTGRK